MTEEEIKEQTEKTPYVSKEDYERLLSQGKREDMERLFEFEILKFKEKKIHKGQIKVLNEYATAINPEIEESEKPTKEEQNELFGEYGLTRYFSRIKYILKEFMDLSREEDYSLISLWIIGTYLHKHFSTYAYLYFNAMKGSGKTRQLKLISYLAKNGKLVGSMTEAVLFRTSKERTICIDELEPNSKGKENLALLLNSDRKSVV